MDVMMDEVAAWAAYAPVEDVVPLLLARVDRGSLTTDGKLDHLLAMERIKAWVDAEQSRTLASLGVEPALFPAAEGKEFVREEIAAALHWSSGTASARLHDAETLVESLPATLALLGEGEISYAHARAVVDTVQRNCLDAATAAKLERRVLPKAPGRTVAELRRDLRRAVVVLDPREAEQKHEDAVAQRRVGVQPEDDAMASLYAYLPAVDVQAIWLATQAVADKLPEDGRTTDQRRADAFVSVFTAVLNGQPVDGLDALPQWRGRRPSIQVSVALSTLVGLDEQPGELDGYGPIPAALARRIAADPTGTWHRLVTDERGALIDYGRTRYRPPQDLVEHITARDRTCRAPGCNRSAERAEIDHIEDWADGWPTNAPNLQALCPRHHHTKHDAGWDVHRDPDGTTRWLTPTGRQYVKPPETYPIDRTRTATIDDDPPPF